MVKQQSLPKAQPPGGLKRSVDRPGERELRRIMQGGANGGRGTGKPTGTPSHFAKWKQDAAVKKHLQKMKTTWLAEQLHARGELKVSSTLHKLAGRFSNVWDLSQAHRSALLEVIGVGPVGIDRLKEYLEKYQVALKWDEPVAH